jgi:hypothetical protein
MAPGYAISVPAVVVRPCWEQVGSTGEVGGCKGGFNTEIRNIDSDELGEHINLKWLAMLDNFSSVLFVEEHDNLLSSG